MEHPDTPPQLPLAPIQHEKQHEKQHRERDRGKDKAGDRGRSKEKDGEAETSAQIVSLPLRNQVAASSPSPTPASTSNKLRAALWYALHLPQLQPLAPSQQQEYLNHLAALVQEVSATVSFHPLTLICEVRSSLKYFRGIDVIHGRLNELIKPQLAKWNLPEHFFYAASPTMSASLLLARAGHNVLVYRKDNLRSVLGELPTDVLELNKEQNRRLYNMGVRQLRDIWRLPTDGLRKRFGSELVTQLNKALGKAPEPSRNYLPPPAFVSAYDLPYELENLDRLLPIADEMFAQLCDFLRRRDLATSQLLFSLVHEKRSCSEVSLGLRQASRSKEHLMLLLETHFNRLTIPAPVTAVRVEVKMFDAFVSRSESLLNDGQPENSSYSDSNLDQFMEQLQARLGAHHVKSINSLAEHCPEYASQQIDYNELDRKKAGTKLVEAQTLPRPLWLLEKPRLLSVRRGQLYHRKVITIVSGPERIETRWWAGQDVRRDYYVGKEQNGSRLWLYRERQEDGDWFLHGFFS